MILPGRHTTSEDGPTASSPEAPGENTSISPLQPAVDLGASIASRYSISALTELLATVRAAINQEEIAVAVLGRFKAGKSSFLNDFIGRNILPVGVVPVTAAVTIVRYGARERAVVHFLDHISREVRLDQIAEYIAERENPENQKQVGVISIELPEMRRFNGLRFVDTPGLDSALAHNTQTSLNWLPNVGLALVAIGVDPPLSQRDIDLLRSLYRYTPKVAVLLTKADLLTTRELAEVVQFVRRQLEKNLPETPHVFPYSTKPGFAHFREAVEDGLVLRTLLRLAGEREAIQARKVHTLLRECADYMALALQSAQQTASERERLTQIVGAKEHVDEARLRVRLVVQHTATRTRPFVSQKLEAHQTALEHELQEQFANEFSLWTGSLAKLLSSFEQWLADALRGQLHRLSIEHRASILEPLEKTERQVFETLQQFRDRLSEGTMRAFGIPLRTLETDINVREPSHPDIRIGRVFDRNWDLLSPILPVWVIKPLVRRHFKERIGYLIYQNLSRLTSQWEESVHLALRALEVEANRRLDELIGTIEQLLATSDERVPQIQSDLAQLLRVLAFVANQQP